MQDILKKNMLSVICATVALLALIAIFFPLGGLVETQKEEMERPSKTDFNELNTLKIKQFELPIIDVAENTAPKPLGTFPYPELVARGENLVKDLKAQAQTMTVKTLERNKRLPLGNINLSVPRVNSPDRRKFMFQYYSHFERLREQMNAGSRPRQEEIEKAIDDRWTDFWEKQIQYKNGQAINEADVKRLADEEAETIPAQLKLGTAGKVTTYIAAERRAQSSRKVDIGLARNTPGAGETTFDYYPGIPDPSGTDFPEVADMWAAQLSLWIQTEVCDAVTKTNQGSRAGALPTVAKAPLKRLVSIRVPPYYQTPKGPIPIGKAAQDTGTGGRVGLARNAPREMREAMTPTPEATVDDSTANEQTGKAFEVSMTGRACNRDYDVMHFTVVVDVEAAYSRTFMANLTNGRFITVIKSEYTALNLEKEFQRGYVYGDNPVIQLKLQCEAIFLREWTEPLMPKEIKDLLKITPKTAEPQAVAGN